MVSGAAGFLGSRLVNTLARSGRPVVAFARGDAPAEIGGLDGVRWVRRDLAADGIDAADFPDVEAVVHLAGATAGARPQPGREESFYVTANEQTTICLLEAFAPRVRRFVLASSQVVYGAPNNLAVTEQFPLIGTGPYATSKINSENWGRSFQARYGGTYLALRLCGFIDGGGVTDYLIDTLAAGKPVELFTGGRIRRDYLPAEDGVAALVAAIDAPVEPGFVPINIGSGQVVSSREIADIVKQALGAEAEIRLLDNKAPQGDFVFDVDCARRVLGFAPTDLREAIRRYAAVRKGQLQGLDN
nr:NAD(P)-dependent oxidoreductase [Sphingomonas sp. R-74633]